MIFGKHNFTSNFLNAVGYQDEFMADQIIIDEVARLIVEDKKDVVEALRKSGVNATYRDNNNLIKAMLVKEIENEDPDILRFLSEKIIQNQIDESKFKEIAELTKMNATGTTGTKSVFVQNVGKVLQNENVKDALGTLIAGGIKKVFSKKNTEKTSNDQQLSERLSVNEMEAAAQNKSKKKLIITLLVVAGALTVGGIVFFLVRRKYQDGGMIAAGGSTIETTASPTL